MEIAIRSEVDSRSFIYPMLTCLKRFGSVCIFTDNPLYNRLVDEDSEVPGFANIEVYPLYPNFNGDLDAAIEESEYEPGKWDWVIWDNVGRTEVDVQLALFTNKVSDRLVQDMMYVIDEEGVRIIKLGTPFKSNSKAVKGHTKNNSNSTEEAGDVNKWNTTKTDEEIFQEKLNGSSAKWIPFPIVDEIEAFEGRHKFITPNAKFIDEFYDIIKDVIGIDKRLFMKGVKVDEDSVYISGIDVG